MTPSLGFLRRFLHVPYVLFLLTLCVVGSGAVAIRMRSHQAVLDQELSQAWLQLGTGLRAATDFLGEAPDPQLDANRLSDAKTDTASQARLGAIGSRIDSLCRASDSLDIDAATLDSLRESIRRDRERVGLALAHYRGERQSFLGKWLLRGFPDR